MSQDCPIEWDESGNVDRMLVASKDVTERNRAESQLRRTLGENARLREELERERDYLREEVNVALNFGRIVGTSQALRRMLKRVEAVAETPANVLVEGESGVGKSALIAALHGAAKLPSSQMVTMVARKLAIMAVRWSQPDSSTWRLISVPFLRRLAMIFLPLEVLRFLSLRPLPPPPLDRRRPPPPASESESLPSSLSSMAWTR